MGRGISGAALCAMNCDENQYATSTKPNKYKKIENTGKAILAIALAVSVVALAIITGGAALPIIAGVIGGVCLYLGGSALINKGVKKLEASQQRGQKTDNTTTINTISTSVNKTLPSNEKSENSITERLEKLKLSEGLENPETTLEGSKQKAKANATTKAKELLEDNKRELVIEQLARNMCINKTEDKIIDNEISKLKQISEGNFEGVKFCQDTWNWIVSPGNTDRENTTVKSAEEMNLDGFLNKYNGKLN